MKSNLPQLPELAIYSPTYSALLQSNFEIIRHVRLGWLAEEELEVHYPEHRINDSISFNRCANVINFTCMTDCTIVGSVYFREN